MIMSFEVLFFLADCGLARGVGGGGVAGWREGGATETNHPKCLRRPGGGELQPAATAKARDEISHVFCFFSL